MSFFPFAAILDIILSWKARRTMSSLVQLRYFLKAITAAAWVIILPVTYAYSWENATGFARTIKSWFGNGSGSGSSSMFILAVVVYLSPNMLSALLFLFPFVRRFLEKQNNKIAMFIMWWSQVHGCKLWHFLIPLVLVGDKNKNLHSHLIVKCC